MLNFQSSKTFQTFQKKCKPRFTELKKAVYLGSEKMSDTHRGKKNPKQNHCSPFKKQSVLGSRHATGDSPRPWRGEEKHKIRNVTLIVAARVHLHFLCALVGSICLSKVKGLHTDTMQLNYDEGSGKSACVFLETSSTNNLIWVIEKRKKVIQWHKCE